MQKIYENEYVQFYLDGQQNIGIAKWRGFVSGFHFRDPMNKAIDIIVENNAVKWLADLTEMEITTEEDRSWVNEEWFPTVLSVGLKRMAIVRPSDIFNQMATEEVMSQVSSPGFVSHYFSSYDLALEWLRREVIPS